MKTGKASTETIRRENTLFLFSTQLIQLNLKAKGLPLQRKFQ